MEFFLAVVLMVLMVLCYIAVSYEGTLRLFLSELVNRKIIMSLKFVSL